MISESEFKRDSFFPYKSDIINLMILMYHIAFYTYITFDLNKSQI